MNPKVSIIILNWNGWNDTIECLESLYQIDYPNYEVIVVDNGSEDESIEKIKQYCKGKIEVKSNFFQYDPRNKPIKILEYTRSEAEAGGGREDGIVNLPSNRKLILIKNEKNFGFAEGNNIAIRYSLEVLMPHYILPLNNDTVVEHRFLNEQIKVAERDEWIAIIGPKIMYYAQPHIINQIGGKMNYITGSPISYGRGQIEGSFFDKNTKVEFLSGTALLIKKKIFEEIGLFDPIYFVTNEETDFEMRAQKAGYNLVCVPKSIVYHKISASLKKVTKFVLYYTIRNRMIFMRRFAPSRYIIIFFLWLYFIDLPLIVMAPVLKNNEANSIRNLKYVINGSIDGLIAFVNEKRIIKK